jgi:3,4-dihydroxy 2-butanone 4-phosphate synthase/GTP cyclohydrolase II
MADSAIFRNAVMPEEADASAAQASLRQLEPYRNWTGGVSVQVHDDNARTAPLPEPAFRLLLDLLNHMAKGRVVAVASIEAEFTTQQAAEVLGVSRPHLIKLLEAGLLPYRRVGSHRRIRFTDIAAFRAGPGARHRTETPMTFDPVEEAIRAIADGEMIVVVDDDDRENEGDLIVAAAKVTREQVAFMIRHTSGILCTPLTPARARALSLDPMVRENNAPLGTAFTISVDYRDGLTTGISADERCNTVRALANDNVQAEDFVRPGHVFPLIAKDGGVLMRSGHTEAATDLMRLAGLPETGVLAELVNDDGSVKRLPALLAFAKEHKLRIISIADLIAYRRAREKLVHRAREFELQTEIGPARAIAYSTPFDAMQHMALVFGDPLRVTAPLVRIHRQDVLGDVFRHGGGHDLLAAAMARIKQAGAGVIVYLREGAAGVSTPDPLPVAATQSEKKRAENWRDVGIGAQILKDLELKSITLLSTHQFEYVGLAGFDIQIAAIEQIGG